MGFCSFCGSELNESDDGPEFLHSLGGKQPWSQFHDRRESDRSDEETELPSTLLWV